MYAAEDYATAHAKFVSNSWSNPEDAGDSFNDAHFDRPGVVITVSTGDTGAGPRYPATNPHVIAVGGTSLTRSGSTFSESAWGGAGSGCSAFEPKPAWQPPVAGCANRAEADVSAVADPSHGVAVYDAGWISAPEGGTSVAAPIIAATFALATPPRAGDYPASYLYGHTAYLNDVRSGSNGGCGAPICAAGTGWDGPTGLGTPSTVDAFAWYNPVRSNAPDLSGRIGTAVSIDLATYVTGGISPYHWFPSLNFTLPPGLVLNQSTGRITGTPTRTGTYTFNFEVLDSSAHGNWFDDSLTWVIRPPLTTVPDVMGWDAGNAQSIIQNAGLVPQRAQDQPVTDPDLNGTVVWQTPAPGTVVDAGTFVGFAIGASSGRGGCAITCSGGPIG